MAIAFRLELPHGRGVGVTIPASDDEALHPEERAFAATLSDARRPSWIAGRVALRAALDELGIAAGPILTTDRGAPLVPENAVGSISHKRALAVGLAAARTGTELGVDLEEIAPLRVDIGRRVLTPAEQEQIAPLTSEARDEAVLLRLSCKEAIYKALDPFVRRYVAFAEVTVTPHEDGSVTTSFALARGEGPFTAEVRWRCLEIEAGRFFLTTARLGR